MMKKRHKQKEESKNNRKFRKSKILYLSHKTAKEIQTILFDSVNAEKHIINKDKSTILIIIFSNLEIIILK